MSAIKTNGLWGTDKVDTSASGATYVTLPDHNADVVKIVNASGTALDVRAAGSTNPVKVADGASLEIEVSANSKEVQVRRTDVSNTQVAVAFIYRKKP